MDRQSRMSIYGNKNRAHFEILQEGKMNRMALPWPPDTIFVAWWQQSLPKKQFISCYFQ